MSKENQFGDESLSSSNYTFGEQARINNTNVLMQVEMIGEDNDDIPSDSISNGYNRNG